MLQVRSCSLGGPTTALRIKLSTRSFLQSHLDCQVHCNLHVLHSPAWQEITTDTPSQTQYLRLQQLLRRACNSSSRPSLLLTSSLCASSHPKPADALQCCGEPQRGGSCLSFQLRVTLAKGAPGISIPRALLFLAFLACCRGSSTQGLVKVRWLPCKVHPKELNLLCSPVMFVARCRIPHKKLPAALWEA